MLLIIIGKYTDKDIPDYVLYNLRLSRSEYPIKWYSKLQYTTGHTWMA